ncbi:lysyl-tRNA synthetase, class II [Geotoga petraea]|uniref:Lysine--tRNA ligase n=1 Tax=Geotoga petraea TaxID=28234 RepID=A0A1G6HX96_9BACT|nr:lysine--tRNA ligase [Geotoga petraea]MDK2945333.1 lysyl-tRNA synthetase, class [Geotoga sp.]SDB98465.1 lysyl-tRNA synthetase, class II [Geotoga petraea]
MSEVKKQRLQMIKELKEQGINPYPYKFEKDFKAQEIKNKYSSKLESGQLLEDEVFSFAGRIMTIRSHGKSAFMHIKDDTGRIQAYIRKDKIGEDAFNIFKKYIGSGDWVGIKGFPFKTKTGELTILVLEIQLLTKTIRQMPEKWHGLKDKEIRYRQRYVDMISNDNVIEVFKTRSLAIRYMREYLTEQGFYEVETPILENIMGGANARPFITHLNVYDQPMYLRIATELHLKRLVVGGMEKVYEIGRIFRNEGIDYKHNPEFTTIELYQAYADYNDIMELTENLLAYVTEKIHGTTKVNYGELEIDFKPPFKRVDMREFIKGHLEIDILEDSMETMDQYLKKQGIEVPIKERGKYIDELWDLVEDKIIQPTFVMNHPVEISPLAKRHREDPRLSERFELIVNGSELANAFSELNDAEDQMSRFKAQAELKDLGDDEAQLMDMDFLRALEYGMPPTGGLGIGIDRFCMFLTNTQTIKDIIAFPLSKPMKFEEEEKMMDEEQDQD